MTKCILGSLLKTVLFILLVFLVEGCSNTDNVILYQKDLEKIVTGQNAYSAGEINYLLYVPQSYETKKNKKWPLILFLHGMGERGSDLNILKKQPLPKTLDSERDFPAIVVSPQLPLDKTLWDDYIDRLKDLIEKMKSTYSVDTKRVYLTGLSMGGAGTWNFALRYPDYFAAIVPIAGAYKFRNREVPQNITVLKNLPIWTFHGAKDNTVESWQTEILVNALKAYRSNIKFTLYSDADHPQSWIKAYADPELYKWLFSKTLE